jgi:hypothetical protein
MAESFLEEQVKRIRDMSEQMSRATNYVAELSNELARDRESSRQNPLQDVRDLRMYPPRNESRDRSKHRARQSRRHPARNSSRRRG